jgi:hypothetical protein
MSPSASRPRICISDTRYAKIRDSNRRRGVVSFASGRFQQKAARITHHPGMHKTGTIDSIVLLSGEVTLLLDEGEARSMSSRSRSLSNAGQVTRRSNKGQGARDDSCRADRRPGRVTALKASQHAIESRQAHFRDALLLRLEMQGAAPLVRRRKRAVKERSPVRDSAWPHLSVHENRSLHRGKNSPVLPMILWRT